VSGCPATAAPPLVISRPERPIRRRAVVLHQANAGRKIWSRTTPRCIAAWMHSLGMRKISARTAILSISLSTLCKARWRSYRPPATVVTLPTGIAGRDSRRCGGPKKAGRPGWDRAARCKFTKPPTGSHALTISLPRLRPAIQRIDQDSIGISCPPFVPLLDPTPGVGVEVRGLANLEDRG